MHFTTYIIRKLADRILWWSLIMQDRSSSPASDVDSVPKYHIRAYSPKKIFQEKNCIIDTFFQRHYLSVEINHMKCAVQILIGFQDLSYQALIIQDIQVHVVVQSVQQQSSYMFFFKCTNSFYCKTC